MANYIVTDADLTSVAHRYVVRDGVLYSVACGPAEFGRTYTEGEVMGDDDLTAEEIVSILTGGAE